MPSVKHKKKAKVKTKPPRRPAPKSKARVPAQALKAPARGKPAPRPPAKATKAAAPKAGRSAAEAARPHSAVAAGAPAAGTRPTAGARPGPGARPKKSSRKERTTIRRGPNGEILAVGEILLPGGTQSADEIFYLFRGCVAAEHPAGDAGVQEILAKRGSQNPEGERADLFKIAGLIEDRFRKGAIEPQLPNRPPLPRRTFQTVLDRAKQRRREIGAFLRGLDLGRTETSHMDAHGEASLDSLMKWAAHLENLSEAREPDQADFTQQHRFLDNLENTTEALIVDIEATLRRLRDRMGSR
jgi:hypothetical protein